MKRNVLFCFFLLPLIHTFCTDFSKIDIQSGTVPSSLKTAPEITGYLTRNLQTPTEKVRAIYYWISHNIQYDTSLLKYANISYSFGERNLLKEVLENRKGVCQHYAELFQTCCTSAGIRSYIISGYSKTDGRVAGLSHAWNAVVIDGMYYEIDATWAAGYVDDNRFTAHFNDEYFMISPAEFIKTHIPFDPMWQLLDNPLTHVELQNSDYSKLKIPGIYNFSDSIKAIVHLDSLNILEQQNRRIIAAGLTNQFLIDYVSHNQQNIVKHKYNQAVREFNKGIEAFNTYIMYKNIQFNETTMPVDKVLGLLTTARSHTEIASKLLQFLTTENVHIFKNIFDVNINIDKLKKKIDMENQFMREYINTETPFRLLLFNKQIDN